METVDNMAGDWIKMRTALANDPAVIAIALDLDKSEFEVVGMLHHLWSWADSQSQDGHIKRVTEKWVDRYVHHSGFAKAMSSAGWLIINDEGITFPNFDRHNGESAKKRAEAAERQRISRANKAAADVTDPSQVLCDKSVTREEKSKSKDQDQKKPPTPKPKTAKPKSDFVLPAWIEQEAWDGFCAMRKEIKKPITENAKGLAVKALEKLALQGHNPNAVLNQSTLHSWQGLFEVKNGSGQTNAGASGQSRPSLVERVRQANAHNLRDDEPPAWEPEPGAYDAEFERIDETDGSLVGADD